MLTLSEMKRIRQEKNVTYEYYDDEKNYSSGVFLCENIFKG